MISQFSVVESFEMVSNNHPYCFAKLFIFISISTLILYIILPLIYIDSKPAKLASTSEIRIFKYTNRLKELNEDVKHILWWSQRNVIPTVVVGEGNKSFIEQNCRYQNCYISKNKKLLKRDYRNFRAVVFDGSNLQMWRRKFMPKFRFKEQIFIYYNMKPADEYPVCYKSADSFFNWTWTYRTDSDIFSPTIEVLNDYGDVVAPKHDVEWGVMKEFNKAQFLMVSNKTKAVAIVLKTNDCWAKNNKTNMLNRLQSNLKRYNLTLDRYGCSHDCLNKNDCAKKIKNYYFYLAYEDNWSPDYVTDEVLKGYDNQVVPIIVGGANYKRFFPTDSYVDAKFIPEDKLAALVDYAIRNPVVLSKYHRWRNHYEIQKATSASKICELCAKLNDDVLLKYTKIYNDFRRWWNNFPLREKCYPKSAESYSDVLSYMKKTQNIYISDGEHTFISK